MTRYSRSRCRIARCARAGRRAPPCCRVSRRCGIWAPRAQTTPTCPSSVRSKRASSKGRGCSSSRVPLSPPARTAPRHGACVRMCAAPRRARRRRAEFPRSSGRCASRPAGAPTGSRCTRITAGARAAASSRPSPRRSSRRWWRPRTHRAGRWPRMRPRRRACAAPCWPAWTASNTASAARPRCSSSWRRTAWPTCPRSPHRRRTASISSTTCPASPRPRPACSRPPRLSGWRSRRESSSAAGAMWACSPTARAIASFSGWCVTA